MALVKKKAGKVKSDEVTRYKSKLLSGQALVEPSMCRDISQRKTKVDAARG